MTQNVEVALYRICHEALNNIRRHAVGTSNVAVSLSQGGHTLVLQVQDDGPGFDSNTLSPTKSMNGLVAMQRRAEILVGSVEINSTPGHGTMINAIIPSG